MGINQFCADEKLQRAEAWQSAHTGHYFVIRAMQRCSKYDLLWACVGFGFDNNTVDYRSVNVYILAHLGVSI